MPSSDLTGLSGFAGGFGGGVITAPGGIGGAAPGLGSAPDSGGGGISGGLPGTLHDVLDAAGSVVDVLKYALSPAALIRFGEAIAGGVLILGGLFLLGAKTDTGQTIVKTAGTAAKGAALA